jgi:palmitoyltransferase
MGAESQGGDSSCISGEFGAKLLAVAFWFILNAMVLSVCLADDSALRRDLLADKLPPKLFLSLVGLTGCLYLTAAFMDPGYLHQKKEAGDSEDMAHSEGNRRDIPPPPSSDEESGGAAKKSASWWCTGEEDDLTGNDRDRQMQESQTTGRCGLPGCGWSYHKYTGIDDEKAAETFCHTCERGVPLRAKHCASCGKCVARYDHHCIWLGNCVGERNHALFWWYLVCQSTAIIWGLYYIESAIKWGGFSDQALGAIEGFIWMNGLKIIIFLFILIWSWLPVCLLAYHTYLLCTNQTTWEFNRKKRITYLKNLKEPNDKPFDQGSCHNVRLMCCTPKLLDWQKYLDEFNKRKAVS